MARRPAAKITIVTGDLPGFGFTSPKRSAAEGAPRTTLCWMFRRTIGKGMRGFMHWHAP
jgi:hypothetical protein